MAPVADVADAAVLMRRRRAMRLAAACIAPFIFLDLTLDHPLGNVVAGVVWVAALLWAGREQLPDRPVLANVGALLVLVVSAVAILVSAISAGGSDTIFDGLLLALPLATLILFPDLWYGTLVPGAVGLAGGAAVRLREGRPVAEIVYWACLVAGATIMAAFGARFVRRDHAREIAAERARADAIAALAHSEAQRARAERLADVARLAGAVSHEINNPLASVKANLQWMAADGAQGGEESAAVLRDTVEAVERIVTVMAELRTASVSAMAPDESVLLDESTELDAASASDRP
jgi:signal transduction histidine kinase